MLLLASLVQPVLAQAPKELNTRPGVAVAVVNLVNPRPDCSVNPGSGRRCRASGRNPQTAAS
jgi:hypothetical protein